VSSVPLSAVHAAVARLDLVELADRRWYAAKGEVAERVVLAHAFDLSADTATGPAAGISPAILALVDVVRGPVQDRYLVSFVPDGDVLREAREGDGAWRALAAAMAGGRAIAALAEADPARPGEAGPVAAALVCRPSPALADLGASAAAIQGAGERSVGRDQSNTSVVLGDDLLLKAYRRVVTGLNPDLEMTAYLSEEAGFAGVPRLAGWAEVVTREEGPATVAMLQAFIPDAADVYETTAEQLTAWVLAPGTVSVEWSTAIAADLGGLLAALHAALLAPAGMPDFAPRPAERDELRSWRAEAERWLGLASDALAGLDREAARGLREAAPAIAARFERFEALSTAPLVSRVHGDLHLGQVLVAPDGYRIIDFEGEPLRPIEDRRRLDSPLRDVASMLRSFDHVARSAGRRAEQRRGGPPERQGLDLDAWIDRARARFLAAYADGLRAAGAPPLLDPDLLEAFEFAKETYELVYAATFLPSWLWAPRGGLAWLLRQATAS
jgi:maltose alpha-D-glucosyltransferase / alpha-amylase